MHDWYTPVVSLILWYAWWWRNDMRIEKWATLLNPSKHKSSWTKRQFAIIPSSSCILDTKTHRNISKSISSEWRVKNWFNRIHYFLFPFLNYKNPSRDINKNAQENDEERRGEASSITHTYAQTWKPGVWWCWWWWLYK